MSDTQFIVLDATAVAVQGLHNQRAILIKKVAELSVEYNHFEQKMAVYQKEIDKIDKALHYLAKD